MILKRILYAALYVLNLAYNMLKSAVQVSVRSLTGSIDPQIVEVETVLRRPVSHVLLANSITLTPGTLTVDVDHESNKLRVAVLTPRKNESIVPFEKYIRGMLE